MGRIPHTPNVILLAIQYLLWSVGTYGFILWLPSIIQVASKQGLGISGLLSAIPYALAIILMLVTSYYSDRMRERKKFVWPYLLVGGIALFISYAIGSHNFWLSFLCLVIAGGCMYAPYGPFFAIMPEILPSNVSGEAMALINSCGALGSFVGVYLVGWIRGVTGGNAGAFVLMGSCLVLSAVLTMIIRMRRPASMGEHTREALTSTAMGH